MVAMKPSVTRLALVLLGLALASCAYRPGGLDNPASRKFSWFSYVEGEDIRNSCGQGTADRFRLVYNGLYEEQIRTYEIAGFSRGDGNFKVHVVEPANLAAGITLDDLMAPWRGKDAEMRLSPEDYRTLLRSFEASGMFEPPPVGLELPSNRFYWTAAMCRGGVYHFTAWRHPSPRFDRLAFVPELLKFDLTGVPYLQPRQMKFDPQEQHRILNQQQIFFTLKVSENGLVGGSLF
jgi:hypothetical protein